MGWNVVKQDERYVVTDNDTLKKLITSTTELILLTVLLAIVILGRKKSIYFVKGRAKWKLMIKGLR